jgi:alpha-glucosidase
MQTQANKHRWMSSAGCVVFGVAVSSGNVWADELSASAASPGKVIEVTLRVADDGRLAYQVKRHGRLLIAPSRLGFVLANGAPLDAGFSIARQTVTSHDETWEQPWGERRFIRDRYTQLRVEVRQKDGAGRRMAIVFRVYDDGVGFRYEFPKQAHMKAVHISDELTEFVLAQAATAWWRPAGEVASLDYPMRKTPLGEVGMADTPLTLRTDDGTHIALHEAALVDYASMWLRRVEGQKLRAHLAPSTSGPAVARTGAFTTPWRTMQIADDAPGLYLSDLILNLNEPNQLGDVSWARPSKFVSVGRGGAGDARRCIDFAAAHGLRGVLVEGRGLGWDAGGPEVDLPGLADYAAARGVRLVGHHQTGGDIAAYASRMEDAYQRYAQLGVDTIKSGHAADAGAARFTAPGGKVRYGHADGQEGVSHFVKAVTEAARHQLSIDSHDAVKDTGLRRTYPNWLSREGARVNLVGGPLDHAPAMPGLRLANLVVIYSPLLMAADLIEHHERYPEAFKFIREVPVDWSDSRMLNGSLGAYATIARKDRHSADWYVGAVTDGFARVLPLPLDFLDAGKTYQAEIYRDDERGVDLVIERRSVRSADRLTLKLAPGGGQAIRFTPIA